MPPKLCYHVVLSRSARIDLEAILSYTAQHRGAKAAHDLLGRVQDTVDGLKSMPERGHIPPEMDFLQIYNFREIHLSPYRIIYETVETSRRVMVHCILDSRRSLDQILYERLVR